MRVYSSWSLSRGRTGLLLRTSARENPRARAVKYGLACLCECVRLRASVCLWACVSVSSARRDMGVVGF